MRIDPRRSIAVAALLAGCAGCATNREGPRPIPTDADCAVCGMGIADLRYACEDERDGRFRFFDSIECLIGADPPTRRAWLADYDSKTLHAADSVWVLHGDIPSPMGGGYAAFLERSGADEVARMRGGQVMRFAEIGRSGAALDSTRAPETGMPTGAGSRKEGS